MNEIFCRQNKEHFFLQPDLQCEKDRDSSNLRLRNGSCFKTAEDPTAMEENKRRCVIKHLRKESSRSLADGVFWEMYLRLLLQFMQMAQKTMNRRHRRQFSFLAIFYEILCSPVHKMFSKSRFFTFEELNIIFFKRAKNKTMHLAVLHYVTRNC